MKFWSIFIVFFLKCSFASSQCLGPAGLLWSISPLDPPDLQQHQGTQPRVCHLSSYLAPHVAAHQEVSHTMDQSTPPFPSFLVSTCRASSSEIRATTGNARLATNHSAKPLTRANPRPLTIKQGEEASKGEQMAPAEGLSVHVTAKLAIANDTARVPPTASGVNA